MTTVVVGGGISGLVTAYELKKRGAEVTLLEAAPRVGGTIQSFKHDGFITEAGPNGFIENEPATLKLVDELGLTDRLRRAEPTVKRRFVFSRGALHELPGNPGAFFTSQILPFGGKLRILGEVFTRKPKSDADESLASFARRHLGTAAAETLVDAMQSGIYAGDSEQLSVAAVFPRFVELERAHGSLVRGMMASRKPKPAPGQEAKEGPKQKTGRALCTFDGGLQPLIDGLTSRLEGSLRTSTAISSLARAGDGWKLETSAGPLQAEKLVLAVPAYTAGGLLAPLDPELASELDGIAYSAVTVVHLGFQSDELPRNVSGFGFLVPEREQRKVMGAIFVSSIFPWRAEKGHTLLTVMVGGARHPELAALPDAELLATVRSELQAILGLRDEPKFTQIVRWARAIPQYNVGHLARIARIQDRLVKFPRLFLTGNAYRGVSMNDCVKHGVAIAERVFAS